MVTIRVHSLGHARAALTAARRLDTPVRIVSPRATPGFAGIGWWREMVRLLRTEFPELAFEAVLDCGPAPGTALAAIRAGMGPLWLDADALVTGKIAGIAEQAEIRVECDGEETLDLLGAPAPDEACREALSPSRDTAHTGDRGRIA